MVGDVVLFEFERLVVVVVDVVVVGVEGVGLVCDVERVEDSVF